jgi:hypothetical protein
MRKQLTQKPTHSSSSAFDNLYEEISDHWQERAKRLQARRWQALKHEMREEEARWPRQRASRRYSDL